MSRLDKIAWALIWLAALVVAGAYIGYAAHAQVTAVSDTIDDDAAKQVLDGQSGDMWPWLKLELTEAQMTRFRDRFIVKPDVDKLPVLYQWRKTLAGWGYDDKHDLCAAIETEIAVLEDKVKPEPKAEPK